MSKKNNLNKGKKAPSVTPQGNMDTEFGDDPKSKLENAAKKEKYKITVHKKTSQFVKLAGAFLPHHWKRNDQLTIQIDHFDDCITK